MPPFSMSKAVFGDKTLENVGASIARPVAEYYDFAVCSDENKTFLCRAATGRSYVVVQ